MAPAEEVGLVWFRRDLRLRDNPAWAAATSERNAVVPLYVIDPALLASVGPYRRRQLLANLQALDYDLAEATGGRLLVRFGDPRVLVPEAIDVFSAGALYLNADVSPYSVRRDDAVIEALSVPAHSWYGSLVLPPGSVLTTKGSLSKVFNAFHKAWVRTPWDAWPEAGEAIVYDDPGEPLPFLDGPPPFFEGEREAHRRLDAFVTHVDRYLDERDRPAVEGTALLSADLRYGTLSPRTVIAAVGESTPARQAFVRQLARRDWYAHLLLQHPTMPTEAVSPKHRSMAWRNAPAQISAWKGGFTGYPIVDAGMRELRETGRLHHRVRLIASSFLVKDLLVDWRIGERHFRHLLVDADLAQNVGNWQSVAGTGTDAAPFNRVLDPVAESAEHDRDGAYLRRWLPELDRLDDAAIHAPWSASPETLAAGGVTLGRDYPHPIVEHTVARDQYLAAARVATSSTARSRRVTTSASAPVATNPVATSSVAIDPTAPETDRNDPAPIDSVAAALPVPAGASAPALRGEPTVAVESSSTAPRT